MAHSTAGQCSVVKRAPTPIVLWPSLPPVRREDGRGRIVLLDEILQREQVRPGGGEHRRAAGQRRSAVERRGRGRQLPRAVARGVLEQRPVASLRGEAALLVFGDPAGLHVGQEPIPVEAEVGRDAGILRDAQVVRQEELIDGGHGHHQIVIA